MDAVMELAAEPADFLDPLSDMDDRYPEDLMLEYDGDEETELEELVDEEDTDDGLGDDDEVLIEWLCFCLWLLSDLRGARAGAT